MNFTPRGSALNLTLFNYQLPIGDLLGLFHKKLSEVSHQFLAVRSNQKVKSLVEIYKGLSLIGLSWLSMSEEYGQRRSWPVGALLEGLDPHNIVVVALQYLAPQSEIDKILINLDGTENKSNIGANAILAVSIANLKVAAKFNKKEIYKFINKKKSKNFFSMPYPLMNIINGGAHANNSLEIQEFMIRPDGAKNFKECMQMSFLVIQNLKKNLDDKKISTSVGDEGGFAPSLDSDEQAIEVIMKSISSAGFRPGEDISICLDVAANELKTPKSVDYFLELSKKYPIKSIEDPFSEDDWVNWSKLTQKIDIQIVGDDLFVTNRKRLEKGIKEKSANSILIKPNQIGTLSETLEVISMAKKANFNTIISHRSGDTEDTFIADLAVATMSSQIKTGSLARSERVAKYNRLLRVEEELGNEAKMARI